MKTFGFTDTDDFAEYLADTFDKICVEDNDDFSEIIVIAKYDVMKDVLNSLIKNTNFKLVACSNLNDVLWDNYDDAFMLTIDPDMNIWVQTAKYTGCDNYVSVDDTDIVFVHGDVNSTYIKQNESECIMNEFNIGDDVESTSNEYNCECDHDNYPIEDNSSAVYKVNGKEVSEDEYYDRLADIEKAFNKLKRLERLYRILW